MSSINETNVVKKQYQNSNNLNTRISIHDKYSTNKMGFGNWIFNNYNLFDEADILELGCGTGSMWVGKSKEIENSNLVLSDFSSGMLDTAKKNLSNYKNIKYEIIDIQNIPYENESFDIVIANMMLYHVPDINQALKEVKRVLKKDGIFYCATYGENGIIDYLSKLLSSCGVKDTTNKNFTLQNGFDILNQHFDNVKRLDYKDSLAVTNIDDLINYIYSLTSMTTLSEINKEKMKSILEEKMENGILNVPKEYGMFICKK